MELKKATYRIHNRPARVAYVVLGKDIYFSSLERNGATVNWAESVVRAICEAEGIQRANHVFYDIQTNTGYNHDYEPSYYCIDRLVIKEQRRDDTFHITGWHPVASSSRPEKLANVPQKIFAAFKQFIV